MTSTTCHRFFLTAITVLFASCSLLFAQSSYNDSLYKRANTNNRYSIDFFALPAIVYNSVTLGFNYQPNARIEHSVKLGAWILFAGAKPTNVNVNYNLNIYYKNKLSYFPIWFGLSNTIRDVGYEEGYYPNTLRPSVGIGYGRKLKLLKRLTVRLEAIAGASVNLTYGRYIVSPMQNLSGYAFDTYYPQYNPRILPALRLKMTFVKTISCQ